MSATTKIAVGVASGYLLGRTKKLRLAITVGSMLAGQRIATNPQALLAQGSKLAENNPELKKLQDQLTGRLLDAVKAAALTQATSRIENVTKSLTAGPSSDEDEEEYADEDEYDEPEDSDEEYDEGEAEEEPEDEYEEPEDAEEAEEPEDAEEPEEEEEEAPRRRTRRRAS
jgi:hypothetical protein